MTDTAEVPGLRLNGDTTGNAHRLHRHHSSKKCMVYFFPDSRQLEPPPIWASLGTAHSSSASLIPTYLFTYLILTYLNWGSFLPKKMPFKLNSCLWSEGPVRRMATYFQIIVQSFSLLAANPKTSPAPPNRNNERPCVFRTPLPNRPGPAPMGGHPGGRRQPLINRCRPRISTSDPFPPCIRHVPLAQYLPVVFWGRGVLGLFSASCRVTT